MSDGVGFRIGSTGAPSAWTGVVRDAKGHIVATCGHSHPNRDNASTYKTAAVPCIKQLVSAALWPHYRKYVPAVLNEQIDVVAAAIGSSPVQFYRKILHPDGVR